MFLWIVACLLEGLTTASTARAAALIVQPTSVAPGAQGFVAVRLQVPATEMVVALEGNLSFDAEHAPIEADAEGRPDCTVNPALNKRASRFAFRPLGCDPRRKTCDSIHAVIVATDNRAPIATENEVWRCRVAVAPTTNPGIYPMRLSELLYSPPEGGDRPASGVSAAVAVRADDSTDDSSPGGGGCAMDVDPQAHLLWTGTVLGSWIVLRRNR